MGTTLFLKYLWFMILEKFFLWKKLGQPGQYPELIANQWDQLWVTCIRVFCLIRSAYTTS